MASPYRPPSPAPTATATSTSPPPPPDAASRTPTPTRAAPGSVARALWQLSVPVHITHATLPSSPPFITSIPRVSYLSLLRPRLTAFFRGRSCSSFRHEDVRLRCLPVGLLLDLYRPAALPWRLVVDDDDDDDGDASDAWPVGDAFLNGVKEADFVRNGHAKQIMGMSKEHTTALWNAVQDGDYPAFARINTRLLNPSTPLRHVPLRIYIPSSPPGGTAPTAGSFRVMQTLVAPRTPDRTPQTLGPTLRSLIPTLFPSSRDPVLAGVVLHGAPVPFSAPLESLMREAAYPDGWVCLAIVLL